jgi:hypothetical protein
MACFLWLAVPTGIPRSFPAWSMRFFLAKEIIAKMPNLNGVLDGLPEHDDELLRLMRSAAK